MTTDPKTGFPISLTDSVPYTFLPKLPSTPLPFDGVEEYTLRVRHLNNTYSTYVASKFLQLNFQNAFLSSNFVDLYALGTFKKIELDDDSNDKRYFSNLRIDLKLWDAREIKVFFLTILSISVIGVGLFLALFALIGMRQQEKENDERSKQELARQETIKLVAKIAHQIGKIGKELLEKEEALLKERRAELVQGESNPLKSEYGQGVPSPMAQGSDEEANLVSGKVSCYLLNF